MFALRLWVLVQLLRWVNSSQARGQLVARRHEKIARKFDALLIALHRAYQNVDCHIETNGEARVQSIIAASKPKIVFDVGANKGDWSRTFHGLNSGAEIYAFEPMKETFTHLTANAPFARAYQIALGAKNEQVKFGICKMSEGSSKYTGETGMFTGFELIDVRAGDDFMVEHGIARIDYLKIDAEGMDYEVLEGFRTAIEAGRIDILQFEYSKKNIEPRSFLGDFYKLLSPTYTIGHIFPHYVDFYPYNDDHEDFMLANFLCVRKGLDEMIEKLKRIDPGRA